MSTDHAHQLTALAAHLAVPSAGDTLPAPLPSEPFTIFTHWYEEEVSAGRQPNPNAMSIATLDADLSPSVRIVLCRGINPHAGYIVFFTNYRGRKGRALRANPRASANFHWDASDRQARFEGVVVQSPSHESDAYFASRRWESRLSAWVSDQSEPIFSREALLAKLPSVLERLGLSAQELLSRGNDVPIPRPSHWGGFRLYASSVELWLGGPGRMHDRAVWRRQIPSLGQLQEAQFSDSSGAREVDAALRSQTWGATRLQP